MNVESFFSHQAPSGGGAYSVPVEIVIVNLSDIVGPSAPSPAPQCGGSLSKRHKASFNAGIPPAKRSRRVSQPSVPESIGTQVDPTDESGGFLSLDQQPEVQQAMRDFVVAIRASQFLTDNKPEPNIGSYAAVALMAVASDKLWRGYGTKAKSIYSLSIEVDGKECKCLWCGDVQKDKLQRAVGHFRAKHLGYETFLVGMFMSVMKFGEVTPLVISTSLLTFFDSATSDLPALKPWGSTREGRTSSRPKESFRALDGAFRSSSLCRAVY